MTIPHVERTDTIEAQRLIVNRLVDEKADLDGGVLDPTQMPDRNLLIYGTCTWAAGTLSVGANGNMFKINVAVAAEGSTISTLTMAGVADGTCIRLQFAGVYLLTSAGNLRVAKDIITYDGMFVDLLWVASASKYYVTSISDPQSLTFAPASLALTAAAFNGTLLRPSRTASHIRVTSADAAYTITGFSEETAYVRPLGTRIAVEVVADAGGLGLATYSLLLSHGANILLPGARDIYALPGHVFDFLKVGTGQWRMVSSTQGRRVAYGALANKNGSQSIAAGGFAQLTSFTEVYSDPAGLWVAGSNGFVVPAGFTKARVSASIQANSVAAGRNHRLAVAINGNYGSNWSPHTTSYFLSGQACGLGLSSGLLPVTAGDVLTLWTMHSHGSPISITLGHFAVELFNG